MAKRAGDKRGTSAPGRGLLLIRSAPAAPQSNAWAPGQSQCQPSRPIAVAPLARLPAALLGAVEEDRALASSLKQPFVIENRAGANGNLGTEAVAKAASDGYTLLLALDTILTAHPALFKSLPFDPERDFTPISVVADIYQMLVVHPSLPVRSLEEFVNYAKVQPVTYGGGVGNPRSPAD